MPVQARGAAGEAGDKSAELREQMEAALRASGWWNEDGATTVADMCAEVAESWLLDWLAAVQAWAEQARDALSEIANWTGTSSARHGVRGIDEFALNLLASFPVVGRDAEVAQ